MRYGSALTTNCEQRLQNVEFMLTTIRRWVAKIFLSDVLLIVDLIFRCGDSQCFFYMEVGRHSAIGAGELWMETVDPLIAQNMHRIIIK